MLTAFFFFFFHSNGKRQLWWDECSETAPRRNNKWKLNRSSLMLNRNLSASRGEDTSNRAEQVETCTRHFLSSVHLLSFFYCKFCCYTTSAGISTSYLPCALLTAYSVLFLWYLSTLHILYLYALSTNKFTPGIREKLHLSPIYAHMTIKLNFTLKLG